MSDYPTEALVEQLRREVLRLRQDLRVVARVCAMLMPGVAEAVCPNEKEWACMREEFRAVFQRLTETPTKLL